MGKITDVSAAIWNDAQGIAFQQLPEQAQKRITSRYKLYSFIFSFVIGVLLLGFAIMISVLVYAYKINSEETVRYMLLFTSIYLVIMIVADFFIFKYGFKRVKEYKSMKELGSSKSPYLRVIFEPIESVYHSTDHGDAVSLYAVMRGVGFSVPQGSYKALRDAKLPRTYKVYILKFCKWISIINIEV